MILSISNWFTDRAIVWIAAGITCAGFVGPGLFGLAPPTYFSSSPVVSVQGVNKEDSKTSFSLLLDEPSEPIISADQTTTKPPEDIKMTPKGSPLVLDTVEQTDQKYMTGVEKDSSEITLLDRSINQNTGDPLKPSKSLKELKSRDVEIKSALPINKAIPLVVPREFITKISSAHSSLSGAAQKESFINIALPLILAGNDEVVLRRAAIRRANQNDDRANLEKWARLYDVTINNQDNGTLTRQLLSRADVIPVPIALAQAAVESGWGTSRFAMQGNALFGQWAWRDDAGLRPLSPSNERAVVRSFGTLLGSVRAYIHNLNTHTHYQDFRNARVLMHSRPSANKTKILVKYLDRYAEIGPAYVAKLETLIRTNDFERYASAHLN